MSDGTGPATLRRMPNPVQRDEYGRRINESHPNCRITDETVDQIRVFREVHHWTLGRIAEKFGLKRSTVQKICAYTRRACRAATP